MELKKGNEKKGYCGIAQAEPGITNIKKENGKKKKTSGLTILYVNGYIKVFSATLTYL